jgi:hypothetical protein
MHVRAVGGNRAGQCACTGMWYRLNTMIRDSHLRLKPICSTLLNCESEIIREPYSVDIRLWQRACMYGRLEGIEQVSVLALVCDIGGIIALLNCESEIIREPYSVAEVQHCNNPADITYQCKHTDLLYSLQPPVHACPLPQSYVTQPLQCCTSATL